MFKGCVCKLILFFCTEIESIVNANFLRILLVILNIL